MNIAPGIDSTEWRSLDLGSSDSPDWCRAVEILERRICERFLGPVDCLIAADEARQPANGVLVFPS